MSDAFWIALMASLPATIAALGALIIGLITTLKLNGVHKQINSRMDQLLVTTAIASKAEGVVEERQRVANNP